MCKKRALVISVLIIFLVIGFRFITKKLESNDIHDETNSFIGQIIELGNDGYFIVEPVEDAIERRSSDRITVQIMAERIWEVGMYVTVYYTGEIMESYPAQINTIDVKVYIEDSVSMIIKDGSVKRTGLELILSNHSSDEYIYGEPYHLEYKENDEWKMREAIIDDWGFITIAYQLKAGKTVSLAVDWEWLYGKLPAGEYRITKEISGKFDSNHKKVEFVID